MNLALDIGNTAVKWATFEGGRLAAGGTWQADSGEWPTETTGIERAMACVSGNPAALETLAPTLRCAVATLGPDTPLPIRLDYKTPATLGPDRIAAACGARALHPDADCLVIDAGTCITVDFLDRQGTYHGGAIMPGIDMSLKALHTFTAKLPLVGIEAGRKAAVLGRSTEESIVAGTLGAATLALAGYVALYREKRPQLQVLLTGGDAARLNPAAGWQHVPGLTLIGLNEIMTYNEK